MSGLSALLGLVFTAGALWAAHDAVSLRREGLRADGTVVGTERELEIRSDGVSLLQRPLVEFRPAGAAEPVRFRADLWTAWSSHATGATVTVLYRAEAPADARLDSLTRDVVLPLILGIIALGAFTGRLTHDNSWTLFRRRWEDD